MNNFILSRYNAVEAKPRKSVLIQDEITIRKAQSWKQRSTQNTQPIQQLNHQEEEKKKIYLPLVSNPKKKHAAVRDGVLQAGSGRFPASSCG